jgi:predicted transcriptional regulator
MDTDLHTKHKNLTFPNTEMVDMYIDIMKSDPTMLKVFTYIAKESQSSIKSEIGITINDLVENIQMKRLVRKDNKGKNYTYESVITNLHRKTAEKIVDRLQYMSLLYYKAVKPYKFFYLTIRGKQLIKRVVELRTAEKVKGDEF